MPAISFAEALAVAVKIEDNGIAFYEEAARQSADPAAMEVFRKLAAFEKEHKNYFARLAKTAEAYESRFATDPKNEFASVLSAMADNSVFDLRAGSAGMLHSRENAAEVVRMAIGLEKDSVIFYLGLKESMREKAEAENINEIIREEMRHITILHDLLKKQA